MLMSAVILIVLMEFQVKAMQCNATNGILTYLAKNGACVKGPTLNTLNNVTNE